MADLQREIMQELLGGDAHPIPPGATLIDPPAIDWGDVEAVPANGANAARLKATPAIVSGAEVWDRATNETRGLIVVSSPGAELLHPGFTIFAARPKAGKSWLSLQIAVAVAGGVHPEGLIARETGPVLYGALEEPETRTSSRLKRIAVRGDWLKNLHFFYSILPLMGGGAEQLEELIRDVQPRLLIVDTLTALLKISKNSGDVFRAQYEETTRVRLLGEKYRLPILACHHTRKAAGGDAVESVAGTGGVTGGADAVWVMRKKPDGYAELEITGREVEEASLSLRFDKGDDFGWHFEGTAAAHALSDARKQVLTLLGDEGPQTVSAIGAEIGKKGGTLRMFLKRMVESGLIVKDGEGYRTA